MLPRLIGVSVVILPLVLTGCRKNEDAVLVPEEPQRQVQTGVASWYGQPFQGRPTASGEIFDMAKMTAAHRTLRFGTVVRVENVSKGVKVEVRINDRGPFVEGRIIDLSHAAAQAIALQSTASVRLQVVSIPAKRGPDVFAVQVGMFHLRSDADSLRKRMEAKYGPSRLIFREGDEAWRVLVGEEPSLERANALAGRVSLEARSAFVVLVDFEE